MTIEAKIIADSISETKKRITTFQLKFPRFILPELATHRVFSKSASSSRAVPVKKMIEMAEMDTAMPIHWGADQPGMQAEKEVNAIRQYQAQDLWEAAMQEAMYFAGQMARLGLHKQVINRILEPFLHISVVLTGTEFDNFFELRCHQDAQPEMQMLACAMRDALTASKPVLREINDWHLPYITDEDRLTHKDLNPWDLHRISAARCCRVSYLKHDGEPTTIENDLKLAYKLLNSVPRHSSPFEHQATPDKYVPNGFYDVWDKPWLHGNLVGWIQFRKIFES